MKTLLLVAAVLAEAPAIEMEVERDVDGVTYHPWVRVWRGAERELLAEVVADVAEEEGCGEEYGHTMFQPTGGVMFSRGEEIALEAGDEKRAGRFLDDREALLLSAAASGALGWLS